MPRKTLHFQCLGGTFLCLVLAFAAGLLPPYARAARQASGGDGSQPRTRSRYKRPSLDDQVTRFAKTLDLNSAQQSEVKRILERQQAEGRRIASDPSLSGMDPVSKFRALEETTVRQIRAVLNEEQRKKYDPLVQSGAPKTSPQPSVDDWMRATKPK
jgi:hypothetical protein